MGRSGTGRSLKTARAVLRVLRFLAANPAGVRTDDVARYLDKSAATASYLLNSLCQEGYAARDPRDGRYRLLHPDPEPPPETVSRGRRRRRRAHGARGGRAVRPHGPALLPRRAAAAAPLALPSLT